MSPSDHQDTSGASEKTDGASTLVLLEEIKDGTVDPKSIRPVDRRQLVAFLMGDGYSTPEIARIFKVTDRTVERDKKEIREGNAIPPNPRLVEEMVGRLIGETDRCTQRIRKASKDREASQAVKVDAEHRCHQILIEMVGALQRLGYLPTAAQKVDANLNHHLDQLPDLEAMRLEAKRLELIARQAPPDSKETDQIVQQLGQHIEQIELVAKIEELSSAQTDEVDSTNDQHE